MASFDKVPEPLSVSPAATRVIDALREKPELLAEVVRHFQDGWPTKDLVEKWAIEKIKGVPLLCRRLFDSDQAAEFSDQPVAHIHRLTGQGYDGTQWVAAAGRLQPEVACVRHIFDDIQSAAAWITVTLKSTGFILDADLPTNELLTQFHALLSSEGLTAPVLPPGGVVREFAHVDDFADKSEWRVPPAFASDYPGSPKAPTDTKIAVRDDTWDF